MIQTAIILAGGFSTRLQSVVKDVPKPMAPVNGIPFLNYQLNYLKHFGIKEVIISTGHLAEKISSRYKFHFNGMKISYSHEEEALGTGGGIRLALEKSSEKTVLVLNGDSFFDADLNLFYKMHTEKRSNVSLSLRKVPDASRYGGIETNANNKIISFKEKNGISQPGLINAGIYILEKDLYLQSTPPDINFSIEKDFFENQLNKIPIYGFEFNGYFIDIGIPEDYIKAQNDFKEFKYR
jgi:D-glycero-alpha-D-manno-heptose 1-phosphate guanylyltransferase